MKKLNYSSAIMEKFAIRTISKSFDEIYSTYVWHDKDDDFDFTSLDNVTALEVATILPSNVINAIKYEKALDAGKTPDINQVVSAYIDKSRELIIYYGDSMDEIRKAIKNMIYKKEIKRKKRIKKYYRYELCLCIDEGALFHTTKAFEFIVESRFLNNTGFLQLFLITCTNFFVIENNEIREYPRII